MTAETKNQYELLEDETRVSRHTSLFHISISRNLIGLFQMVLTRAANLCDLVHIETSLLPKPVKKYRKLIADLNELVNLWSGLRAIRQNIPRKLTVLDVLPQRTELVSEALDLESVELIDKI